MTSAGVGQDQPVKPGEDLRMIGVAISVAEPYGELLREFRASFGDDLAVSVPTHVTLLPPTEVPAAALPMIEGHLAAVADRSSAFQIDLHGTGTFRPVSPVVFVKLAAGADRCAQLDSLIRLGPLHRELHFDYHPHVTVAHHLPDDVLNRAEQELAGFSCSFPVPGFKLYQHGADRVWRVVQSYEFAG